MASSVYLNEKRKMEKALKEVNNGTESDKQNLQKIYPLKRLNLENNRSDKPTTNLAVTSQLGQLALDEIKTSVGSLEESISKNVAEAVCAATDDLKATISETITEAVTDNQLALDEIKTSVRSLEQNITKNVMETVGAANDDIKESISETIIDAVTDNQLALDDIKTSVRSLEDKVTTSVIQAVGAATETVDELRKTVTELVNTINNKSSESAQRMDGIQNNVAELAELMKTTKSSLSPRLQRKVVDHNFHPSEGQVVICNRCGHSMAYHSKRLVEHICKL